ncbi:MAG: transglycosylase domain-containing protein [Alphaproteobacteria bacterium]|nr:transglycosylase domain-containing protein [Alphaproteobacteria bacterium]
MNLDNELQKLKKDKTAKWFTGGKYRFSMKLVLGVDNRKKTFVKNFILYSILLSTLYLIFFLLIAFFSMPKFHLMMQQTRPAEINFFDKHNKPLLAINYLFGDGVLYKDTPEYFWKGLIAIEDRKFFEHNGIYFRGIIRAVLFNLTSKGRFQGGSTISQQLAKNLFLTRKQTITRKVQELMLTIWIERTFSKEQILNLYLSRVSLVKGLYGFHAASKDLFQKPLTDISISDSAILISMLKAPTRYNPSINEKIAMQRRDLILKIMLDRNIITNEEFNTAKNTKYVKPIKDSSVRYFTDWVKDELEFLVPQMYRGQDLYVYTTIDQELQKRATIKNREIIKNAIANGKEATQSAILMTDEYGGVQIMIGGVDYASSQFNRTILAKRQPGSLFKPVVYATAFEYGWTPDSLLIDEPISIDGWEPENYNNKYKGEITLQRAFESSINTIPIRLGIIVSIQEIYKTVGKLKLGPLNTHNLSIVLGTSETTIFDLSESFSIFNNDEGTTGKFYGVRFIENGDREVIYQKKDESGHKVFSTTTLENMRSLFAGVISSPYGTAYKARNGPFWGGKTGTSQGYRDAWFLGFGDDFNIIVWVGNDNNSSMKKVTGSSIPLDIATAVAEDR